MRYLGVSIAAGVCLLAAGAANAEERLGDADLDRVVAGVDLTQLDLETIFSEFTIARMPILRVAAAQLAEDISNQAIDQNEGIETEADVAASPVGSTVSLLSDFGQNTNFFTIELPDP